MLAFGACAAIQGLRSEQDARDQIAVKPAAVRRTEAAAAVIERCAARALAYGACGGVDRDVVNAGNTGLRGCSTTRPKAKGLGRPHLWQESACKNRRCKGSSVLPRIRNSRFAGYAGPPLRGVLLWWSGIPLQFDYGMRANDFARQLSVPQNTDRKSVV